MTDKKLSCLECSKRVANTSNVLARHIRTAHGIEWADYVVKYDHGGEWPTCACGCGERLPWKKGGFSKYVQGHDNKGIQNSRSHVVLTGPGWVPNPFTGREEHIGLDDEIAFLQHCIDNNDPVTHDHGIRVGWEDSRGKLRVMVPSFKHLQKKLIITVDSPVVEGFDRRISGMRSWCDDHGFIMLVLKRDDEGFSVIAAHRRKENDDAKERGKSEKSDETRSKAGTPKI